MPDVLEPAELAKGAATTVIAKLFAVVVAELYQLWYNSGDSGGVGRGDSRNQLCQKIVVTVSMVIAVFC